MARINRISIALCALLFTTLPLMPIAHASKQAGESSTIIHITREVDKKKSTATTKETQETAKETASKNTTKSKIASSVKKSSITASKNVKARSRHAVNKTASANFTERCAKRKDYKSHCVKVKGATSGTLADAHKAKVQGVTKVAMNKLMQRIGEPYRWGDSSPCTGFDCSGLVYYTYKDLMKIRIPCTANEVHHLRDAASVERSELKNGDLIFLHTQERNTAGCVGVYVGNGKFVQPPRVGQEIQTASLSEDYW